MKSLSTDKAIFLTIAGFTALILVLIVLFSTNEQKQSAGNGNVSSYSSTDSQKPQAKASSTFFDLGNMKVSDEKKADFIIENTGQKPLELFKVSSSCDCTFGQIEIDGVKSPEFSMHAKGDWTGNVDPGKKATLSVIYRPKIMPVKGVVTRDVFVQTNDPDKKQLTFSVKAIVD